jgi:aminopeptidase N
MGTSNTKHNMRHILCTALAALLLLGSCNRSETTDTIYGEGVSLELAQLRKKEIHNLKYSLAFSIPEQREEDVEGEVNISFTLQKRQEIVIDFRESKDNIKEIAVNGQPADYKFGNEHIIIPESASADGHNEVSIRFIAGNQSLNRNEEFLYTLLVPDRARTLFPCFDQPNLKAEFTLSLDVPAEWEAVSNTSVETESISNGRKSISFKPTEPLSTYLFSFVTGKLKKAAYQDGDRTLTAYHRESDPKKVAQLDIIFKQVSASLRWLEEYTAIPYPFAKYDIVILPGFQYGGMEHTGATLYNDTRMFLSEHPTLDEELSRSELIAHETAHMWFGDFVTMDWFNDVWTKEVFANYFAACITEPLFPSVNHSLNWIKNYPAGSLEEDRTLGTNSIRQPLDNLRNAGLIYGNIIYDKAPVMMRKLVEIMGEEAYREGIREYLRTYAYGNATWDDLITILDAKSDADLAAFSDVWVNQKGMPHITFSIENGGLYVRQNDPLGRGLVWPQRFSITFAGENGHTYGEINLDSESRTVPIPDGTIAILPNTDGRGYGLFIPDSRSMDWMLSHWHETDDETARQALLMTLYENYQAKNISDEDWLETLLSGLDKETNALIASTICSYISEPLRLAGHAEKESRLWNYAEQHDIASCRLQLLRCLIYNGRTPQTTEKVYNIWKEQSHPLLSERDYTNMAYELSIHLPQQQKEICATQRSRITNTDRIRQFDFISQAVTSDTLMMDSMFRSLLQAENRRIEPWAATALAYLSHPMRGERSVKYIRPGLEILQEVQRTGDIFFPKRWANALLKHHRSEEAYKEVEAFLKERPDYPPLIMNKILQAAWPLYREHHNTSSIQTGYKQPK